MSFTCPYCQQPHEEAITQCPATGATISPAHHMVGKIIAEKYQIEKLLGEGGMGAVYLAKHTQVGKRFAIKLLHEQFAHYADMVERFMREARAAGEVGHENIIEVYDIGREPSGSVFMVMEILKGSPLEDVVRQGPMAIPAATYVMLQVLAALEAAHPAGIVHRDMKPDNVFLTTVAGRANFVKVLDFGIAKVKSGEGGHGLTQTGTMMGTPYYMSPEQARGSRDIDHRTDLYACGVMFYQMLVGDLPFDAPNIPALLMKITMEDPLPIEQLVPGMPAELAAAVHKSMAKDPDARFQSAGEFAEAIRPFTSDQVAIQGLQAAAPAFDTIPGSPGSTGAQKTPMGWTASGEAQAPKKGNTGVIVGAVVGVLVLLLGGGAAALFATGVIGGKKDEPKPITPLVQPTDGAPKAPITDAIKFQVTAEPSSADIFLNGGKLDGNPVDMAFQKEPGSKLLEVKAEGYQDHKEWVRMDGDVVRTVKLDVVAAAVATDDGGKKKIIKKGTGTEGATETPVVVEDTGGKGKKGKGKGSIDEDNPYQ